VSDYSSFTLGTFFSPLTSSTAHSLLLDADPALAAALAFYQAVIAIHLGARFDAEVARAGLPTLAGKITALATPRDPLPYLQQAQLTPPLLALYPATDTPSEKTRNWYHVEGDWKLLYVLPPLTAAQDMQLGPILRAIFKVVQDRTELGYDPAYQSGALVLGAAGVEQIAVKQARYGNIQGLSSNLFFPSVEIDLVVYERKNATPGLSTAAGLDGTAAITDPAGANAINVVNFQQDLP
jgi:hypothetical protein